MRNLPEYVDSSSGATLANELQCPVLSLTSVILDACASASSQPFTSHLFVVVFDIALVSVRERYQFGLQLTALKVRNSRFTSMPAFRTSRL